MKSDRQYYQRECERDQRNYGNRNTPSMHFSDNIGPGPGPGPSRRREGGERRFYSDNKNPGTLLPSQRPRETLTEPVYDRHGTSKPTSESGSGRSGPGSRVVISAPPKLKKLVDY